MRMLLIAIPLFIFGLAFATLVWYALTPAFMMGQDQLAWTINNMTDSAALRTYVNNTVTIMRYQWWWIIIMIVGGLVVWLLLIAQRREGESVGRYEYPR